MFWDENGVFRFWNLDTVLSKQELSVRSIGLDDVSDLNITNTLDSVRNVFTIQATKRRASNVRMLYESNDLNEFYVPGRTRKKFRIWLDNVLSPLTFFMTRYSGLANVYNIPVRDDDVVTHGYIPQYLFNNVWQERDERSGLDINVYFTIDGYLIVNVWNGWNGWNEPVRLAKGKSDNPDPEPAFRFAGTPPEGALLRLGRLT